MGFRFRKSVRIVPGIRLNISKTGVSTSVGRRGATANFSRKGVRGTVGLPGTGMSWSGMLSGRRAPGRRSGGGFLIWFVAIVILVALFH